MVESEFITALKQFSSHYIEGNYSSAVKLMVPFCENANSTIAANANYYAGFGSLKAGDSNRAEIFFQKSFDKNCKNVQLYEVYGTYLAKKLLIHRAEQVLTAGVERCGETADILAHLASIKVTQGALTEAEKILKKAEIIDSKNIAVLVNLGNLYEAMGRVREGINASKKAVSIDEKNATAISNLMLLLNYVSLPKTTIYQAHGHYNQPIEPFEFQPLKKKAKIKKIKIGFISIDFRMHAVAHFFLPILQNVDRKKFEIYCYSDSPIRDKITSLIEKKSNKWREIYHKNDQQVAELLRKDKVDILINLSGHAGGKRISLYKSKPVEHQIVYLGYPNTLGIKEMDYRIVDAITDPEGEEKYSYEKLIRIDAPFICYNPILKFPDIRALPALQNNYITFGSFNRLAKLSEETVDVWSSLLHSVPASIMYIKTKALDDEGVASDILKRFLDRGIGKDRIRLEGWSLSGTDHLDCYHKIDIALDSFPYNGTTTTCEALYMGVPVMTIRGDRHSARVSATILESVSLGDFVANDYKDFVSKASYIASRLDYLEDLRRTLRRRVDESSLTDGKNFSRKLEAIFTSLIKTSEYRE